MTPETNVEITARKPMNLLRQLALAAVLAGAVGSLWLTLHAGRHNNSRILMLLFAIWVLAPFMALAWANVVSKRWPILSRAVLHTLTLVLAPGSLAIYGVVALGPPRPKTAFAFLVVPPISWMLIAVAVLVARTRRRGTPASR